MTKQNNPVRNVLWTAGWDSTYHVLNLVIVEKATVRPYYVKDPVRPSMPVELRTMEAIRAALFQKFPEARSRLLDTVVVEKSTLKPNPKLTETFIQLQSESRFGGQYEWLARLAHEFPSEKLELCVHSHDRFSPHIGNDIFSAFAFPLLGVSKLDMEKAANRHDFRDLMELTWFCHKPIWLLGNPHPCGKCNPCTFTRAEGLEYRLTRKYMDRVARAYGEFRRLIRWLSGIKRRLIGPSA
jgi:hypothetical protein